MLAKERQRKILQEIKSQSAIKVSQLGKLFSVSEMTIRRDLEKLNEQGLIERVYGGVLSIDGTAFEPTFLEKETVNMEEKRRIGRMAVSLIKEKDTVFFGPGTTVMQIVKNLGNKHITCLTNALNIAFELAKLPNVRLFVIGGELRSGSCAMIGPETEEYLQRFYVDKFFVGVNGLSVKHGITIPNSCEAVVYRAMTKLSRETIVVADHTKVENVSFVKICDIDSVDKLITDSGISEKYVHELKEKEIKVIVV
ncbi:DeoR/GlpR transcriptional regulator [Candidatus Aerophobetes bacterium]|nr:DeoR/GlpR transcriptional regulator [Candidatus Aerophobetes bacterium]